MLTNGISTRLALAAALTAATLLGACASGPASPAESHELAHSAGRAQADLAPGELARLLADLRRATAGFHNFEAAQAAGYDAAITPCWDHVSQGAMGYHYGKGDIIRDGVVEMLEPELLMYEPQAGGHMRLVGMEYIVFIEDWEAIHGEHAPPPTLFGETFTAHSILPIYKLHVWLWRDNPRGTFADWNPKVSCRHADETETFD